MSCASKLACDSRLGSFCWRCVVLRELTPYGLENSEGPVALRDLDEVGALTQGDVEFVPLRGVEFSDAVTLHVEDADVVRAAVDALKMECATVDSPADCVVLRHGFNDGDTLGIFCAERCAFCAGRLRPGDFCA